MDYDAHMKHMRGTSSAWLPRLIALVAAVAMAASMMLCGGTSAQANENAAGYSVWNTPNSTQYAKAMGNGWNLGNALDSAVTDWSQTDKGEEAWGNPKITRSLIHAVKEKGYTSIRIPMTVYHRFTENWNAKDGEYRYVINADWLKRYREVVDWAVDEGLYVMIDIHHDSWVWLKNWDGNTWSNEYRMFTDFWKQLANYFADEPGSVCFETINEPQFDNGDEQAKLNAINKAAYDVIRSTNGNQRRMIVMPSIWARHTSQYAQPLSDFIAGLNDDHVMATVHYYSEWVYSANVGKTGFDEQLYGDSRTARTEIDSFAARMKSLFTDRGIGLVIGEYGLLGYDSSENCLETGEELKYYEYMAKTSREHGFAYVFWDNGSGIDRTSPTFAWKKPAVGEMLEASMKGRSSYATGLDTLYFKSAPTKDVSIPLTLNGNEFRGIDGLTEGNQYVYDAATTTVTLRFWFVDWMFNQTNGCGQMPTLTFRFSSGAPWHEYFVHNNWAWVTGYADGSRSKGFDIPITFNANKVRNVYATQTVNGSEQRVGPNSGWWQYLQYDAAFGVDYGKGTLTLHPAFFDSTVKDGPLTLYVTFFDGHTLKVSLYASGDWVGVH